MSSPRNHDGSDAAASASGNPIIAHPPAGTSAEAVMAYVLFIDIVGHNRLALDHQPQMITRLHQLAQATDGFQKARAANDLVSRCIGDGLALVFFRSPEQPAACAVEIARALRRDPFCQVRMGIHSGLVFRFQDINGAPDVSGAGIGLAERVMSCGGGGHILMSETVAHTLRHLIRWKDCLHDVGVCGVKDGTLHIWNLYDAEVGSTARVKRRVRFRWPRRVMISAATLLLIAVVSVVIYLQWPPPPSITVDKPPPPSSSLTDTALVTVGASLPFRITLEDDVAAAASAGQPLRFTATDGLKVGEAVVIEKGATVMGSIVGESGRKFLGVGKKATFRLLQADAVDGQKLSVGIAPKSSGKGLPSRALDTGKGSKSKELAAAKGTEYVAYTDGEQTVVVRK